MEFFLKRSEGQQKKTFYLRMAQMRKQKWGSQYRHRDDHYRFHFMKREHDEKTKPIGKGEPRCEQRIRNRMAAQQSRERHRSYVEELERKAKIYDQLVATQQLVCKQCRQSLTCDLTESDEISLSPCGKDNSTKIRQEPVLESYLNEELIRIDNGGSTSPFGIFFVVCLIAVLAIGVIHSQSPAIPRILAADIVSQSSEPSQGSFRNFVEYIKSHRNQKPEVCDGGDELSKQKRKNLRSYNIPQMGWKQVGQYICSAPEWATVEHEKLNQSQQVKDNQEMSLRQRAKDWQRVEISQCFRNIP